MTGSTFHLFFSLERPIVSNFADDKALPFFLCFILVLLCPKRIRGLLLLRVRDELRMTIAAYQTLYESSVAFGMRKALQTEQGKADMEARIQYLETENKELEKQVNEWKMKCESIEKRENERRQAEEKKHKEEVEYLTRHAKQLKQQLETVLQPGKK